MTDPRDIMKELEEYVLMFFIRISLVLLKVEVLNKNSLGNIFIFYILLHNNS